MPGTAVAALAWLPTRPTSDGRGIDAEKAKSSMQAGQGRAQTCSMASWDGIWFRASVGALSTSGQGQRTHGRLHWIAKIAESGGCTMFHTSCFPTLATTYPFSTRRRIRRATSKGAF